MRTAREEVGRSGTGISLSVRQDHSCCKVCVATSPFLHPLFLQLIETQLIIRCSEIKDVEALIVFKDGSTFILQMCFRERVGGCWDLGCIHVT